MRYSNKDNENNEYTQKANDAPRLGDGQVGIREALKKMGYSDDSIGFNDSTGMVTLNKRDFMKPQYLDNDAGKAYAKEKDIQKSLVDFYSGTSDPVVRVADAYASYAGKYGLSANALTYGNETVMIGGKPVEILYTDNDGKAWARQNAVVNAVDDYVNEAGLSSPLDLAKRYGKQYLSSVSDLTNSLSSREDFKYDPDSDPVFQAYKIKYQLEGERASENSIAAYSALTGGYINSAAATAGAQAAQYYAKKLTDTIPELAQMAYDRYNAKYQSELKLLNNMVDIYDKAYQNAVEANSEQRKNVNFSADSNRSRDNAVYESNALKNEAGWEELFNRQKYEKAARDSYWNEALNTQAITENEYTNEGLRLDNEQKQIYKRYYERLLQAELSGK